MSVIQPDPAVDGSAHLDEDDQRHLGEFRHYLRSLRGRIADVAADIHDRPETRFEEVFAAERLTDELERAGFNVERGIADLPTAFTASLQSGEGGPTVGIFCEYDALQGLGHACGHNLIAAAGLGAALLLQRWLQTHPEHPATVRVLGSPGEEGGGGKIFLQRAGCLDDLSVGMMIHPSGSNQPWFNTLARAVVSVTFTGRAAHAAAAPFDGVNALDAATLALTAIGLLRQQLRPDSRVHAIMTQGGDASNVIPDRTELLMQVRSPSMDYLTDRLLPAVENCINGAALATGTRVKISQPAPVYESMRNNWVLATISARNMQALGLKVEAWPPDDISGSTDMGNVSHHVPSMHPTLMLRAGLALHTRQAADAAGEPSAARVAIDGALLLALTSAQLVSRSVLLDAVREDFDSATGTHPRTSPGQLGRDW